ncbi:hypothetical protein E1166_08250, partial [Micromonospora sp. KC213]
MPADHSPEQQQTHTRRVTRPADAPSNERRIGRHRAPEPPRRGARALLTAVPVRLALAGGVTCCLGLVVYAGGDDGDQRAEPVREMLADRALADERASRSRERDASPLNLPATGPP